MSLFGFTKTFGQSELQENFNSSVGFKWELKIVDFKVFEYGFPHQFTREYSKSSILSFDFLNLKLNVEGELARSAFEKENAVFTIKQHKNLALNPEFILLNESNEEIILLIQRNSIKFFKNSNRWFCIISDNISTLRNRIINQTQKFKHMTNFNELDSVLPKITSFMRSLDKCEVIKTNKSKIEFRIPISTFGIYMGFDSYFIEEDSYLGFNFFQCRTSKNGRLSICSNKINFKGDMNNDDFKMILDRVLLEQFMKPAYREIATNEFI